MVGTGINLAAGKTAAALLAGLLVLLFAAPLKWLLLSLQAPEYRLHSALLVGFVIFVLARNRERRLALERFELRALPLGVLMIGLAGFLYTEKVLDVDVLSCVFFGLTVYGVAGFVVDDRKWRDSCVLVLLFLGCLPLSYHLETFLGFPVRLASAKAAGSFFSLVTQQAHSTETILMVENKLAHVDLPCSGMKSLWSMSLFSLVLSLVERYRVNGRWIAAFFGGWCFVAAANVFRIILLVAIFHSPLPGAVKDSLHAPVGLIGFLVACGATYLLFRALGTTREAAAERIAVRFDRRAFAATIGVLLLAVVVNRAEATPRRTAPPMIEGGSLALTAQERDLFLRHQVLAYDKKAFDLAGIAGTAFLVLAKSWRGHHHPEQCLQSHGGVVERARTLVVDSVQVRSLGLKGSDREVVYWFQSAHDSTADYSSRVWSGLFIPGRPYVMVSLYLERVSDADAFQNLINEFRGQARRMLADGGTHEDRE